VWPDRARSVSSRMIAAWRGFARDQRANVAITFGLALPVVAGFVGVAVDYTAAAAVRSKMQTIADAAAIYAAREFQMAKSKPERIAAVAESYVKSQLPDVTTQTKVDASALTVQVVLEKFYEKRWRKSSRPTRCICGRSRPRR
jgi:Flp pilus assembly protein TadG